MILERYSRIVIEGPIGVGKTSLARKLADVMASQGRIGLQLEAAQENPFLEKFYRDPARFAFPTQLFFLFQRIRQLQATPAEEVPLYAESAVSRAVIGDFLLEKDRLFAKMTLMDEEFALYQQAWSHIAFVPPPPDLVIFLQGEPPRLLERVARRAIPAETMISLSYLEALCAAYSDFFHHYTAAPLMIVNTDHLNPVDNDDDFTLLVERLDAMRGPKVFFNVNGS